MARRHTNTLVVINRVELINRGNRSDSVDIVTDQGKILRFKEKRLTDIDTFKGTKFTKQYIYIYPGWGINISVHV